ncbi:MAG: hypothetical protein M4579_006817 [Chaenotheca gracillima]|nr:MAG: hypothetical protein M4579_006817 [Chaenotheca gracillima]
MAATIALFRATVRPARPTTSLASFLLPCLQPQQQRSASILAGLADNPASYKAKKRRGRGPSSGLGKTSGRGHKGQKQHGKVPKGFQGGQTPLEIVHGKRGFENVFSVEMTPLNLDKLQTWIDEGRIDPTKPITVKELVESRCIHGVADGVKVLGTGADQMKTPINLLVSRASASAIRAIEAAGGTITTRYYTAAAIGRVLRGECDAGVWTPVSSRAQTSSDPESSDSPAPSASSSSETRLSTPFLYRLPDPTSRKDIEYYRDPAHRGYLSHLVPDGEGPSLFFKTPGKRSHRVQSHDALGPIPTAPRSAEKLW